MLCWSDYQISQIQSKLPSNLTQPYPFPISHLSSKPQPPSPPHDPNPINSQSILTQILSSLISKSLKIIQNVTNTQVKSRSRFQIQFNRSLRNIQNNRRRDLRQSKTRDSHPNRWKSCSQNPRKSQNRRCKRRRAGGPRDKHLKNDPSSEHNPTIRNNRDSQTPLPNNGVRERGRAIWVHSESPKSKRTRSLSILPANNLRSWVHFKAEHSPPRLKAWELVAWQQKADKNCGLRVKQHLQNRTTA